MIAAENHRVIVTAAGHSICHSISSRQRQDKPTVPQSTTIQSTTRRRTYCHDSGSLLKSVIAIHLTPNSWVILDRSRDHDETGPSSAHNDHPYPPIDIAQIGLG